MGNNRLELVGQRIKYIRKHHRMRQSDFSKALGTTIKSISDVEQGRIRPNFDILTRLRIDYRVNLDFIFLGIGDPFYGEDDDGSELGVIKHKEILLNTELRNFLHHLLNSKIVLGDVLQFFSNLYRRRHREISKELEASQKDTVATVITQKSGPLKPGKKV